MVVSENKETVVGGLVMVGLALVLLLSNGLGQSATRAAAGYVVYAKFNRIDGLAKGDEVQMAGVRIGHVEHMGLDENFRARLKLRMENDVALPKDTSAAIHTDGLFGSKHIVLEPGAEEESLKDGDSIEFTQDSVVVSDLLELIISEGKARQAKAQAAERAD
ncbi:MAG: outer membrane lipid asymmetry maintenance protein MlaD [Hyphomicrobiales bacterium]|nr:outer membrane lipid asymmetry maintenance protein MlaD [Hyphomicrobiales bacterium]